MPLVDKIRVLKRIPPVDFISARGFEIATSSWLIFNSINYIGLSRFLDIYAGICPSRSLSIPFHLESILTRSGLSLTALSISQIAVSAVMIAFGSGVLLRAMSALLALNAFNLCQYATDGGIDLLQNLLVLFILCPRTDCDYGKSKNVTIYSFLAVTAIRIQILMMYLTAAVTKMVETEGAWKHGTALYYILQVRGLSVPVTSDFVISNDAILTIATYSAILIQLIFVSLCLHPTRGWIALALMGAVHIGIAMTIGLVSFSLLMLSIYPIFFHANFLPRKLFEKANWRFKWIAIPNLIAQKLR